MKLIFTGLLCLLMTTSFAQFNLGLGANNKGAEFAAGVQVGKLSTEAEYALVIGNNFIPNRISFKAGYQIGNDVLNVTPSIGVSYHKYVFVASSKYVDPNTLVYCDPSNEYGKVSGFHTLYNIEISHDYKSEYSSEGLRLYLGLSRTAQFNYVSLGMRFYL